MPSNIEKMPDSKILEAALCDQPKTERRTVGRQSLRQTNNLKQNLNFEPNKEHLRKRLNVSSAVQHVNGIYTSKVHANTHDTV